MNTSDPDPEEPKLYEQLQPGGYIRVLHLEGMTTISNSKLGIKKQVPGLRLKTISLESVRNGESRYIALSYCWTMGRYSGISGACGRKLVVCEESVMLIGENLYNALVYFSSLEPPPVLWADAICINQKNTNERNQQVTLMGDVYRMADHVAIWLGSEGSQVAELWRLFSWFNKTWALVQKEDDLDCGPLPPEEWVCIFSALSLRILGRILNFSMSHGF